MPDQNILISYDGGDASRNTIEAKLFGQSLQGLDRMVSDCILILSQQRLPKRHERAPLILKVREPERGSYEVQGLYEEISTLLAISVPIIMAIGPNIISHYICAALDWFRGKGDSSEATIRMMAEMHRDALAAMSATQREALAILDRADARQDAADERRHREAMGMQELLRLAISSSGKAAVDYVAPIGRSVDTATFVSGEQKVITDKAGADAIRDSQKLDWQPLQNEILVTDGFKFHSDGLSIENPERDGFMMADVDDPRFKEESNAYTVAAQRRGKIEVLARKGYKNGQLAKVQIVEFVREVP